MFVGMGLWLFGFSKFSTVVIRDTFLAEPVICIVILRVENESVFIFHLWTVPGSVPQSWEASLRVSLACRHTHTHAHRMLYGGCIFIDRNLVQEELLRTAGAAGCGWGGILEDWLSRTLQLQKGSVTTFPEDLTVRWNFPGLPPLF